MSHYKSISGISLVTSFRYEFWNLVWLCWFCLPQTAQGGKKEGKRQGNKEKRERDNGTKKEKEKIRGERQRDRKELE